MMPRIVYLAAGLVFHLMAVPQNVGHSQEDVPRSASTISFRGQVEPILRTKCQGCHQPAKPQGGIELTRYAGLLAAGDSGEPAVVPGSPDQSLLIQLITPVDGAAAMPQNSPPLGEVEIGIIRQWIEEGAIDDHSSSEESTIGPHNPPVYSRPPVVTSLAYSPDGRFLASSGFHEALLIETESYVTLRRLVGLSERVQSVVFSPDSARLAITGGSPGRFGEAQIWNVESGELELSHQVTYDVLFGGSFSPDGKLLAFGATDRVVRAIDIESGQQRLQQGAHEDWSLATVFNPSGTHLLSGGRDMTVKLTEVATERFVDNVTSITPGALKGGVSALAMHPSSDQVLVGGADGVPKIYRIFRETARRIGDDANLIRKFAAMSGRIFSLSVSRDGSLFAVASTLDGNSQIKVYPFEFLGEIPNEVNEALAKPVDQRSDEEKNRIDQFFSQTSPPVTELDIADSVYAIAFHPSGDAIAVGGADGKIRVYSVPDGRIMHEFIPVPLTSDSNTQDPIAATTDGLKGAHAESNKPDSPAAEAQEAGVTARIPNLAPGSGMALGLTLLPDTQQERALLPTAKLLHLEVGPKNIELQDESDYVQLVVTAVYSDGSLNDVTRLATYSTQSGLIGVDRLGLVRINSPNEDTNTQSPHHSDLLTIEFGDESVDLPVEWSANETAKNIDFVRDVNPILSRLGCNSGTCHGAQQGKNGFQLSLRGYDPLGDIRSLSDDLSARRLNTAAPDASLMLLKPAGRVPHEGGTLMTGDSVYYKVLREWIAQGAGLNRETTKVQRIEIHPTQPVMEKEGAWQQFRVVAYFADGHPRDVTHEAFLESSNSEVCESLPGGRVKAIRRGEASMLARYEGAYAAASLTVMGDRSGFHWQEPEAYNTIDQFSARKWERMKIIPSGLTEDHEFLRRVRLDLTGLPPSVDELKDFLNDSSPSRIKRQAKIDELLGSNDYIEHWTNKWADLLQVNSKFLGSEGAAAFRQWIRAAVADNVPYDEFARRILTASGSNKDNPAASYYKILRDPDLLVENTTHLFLAVRFNCNKCHDHPFERWTQDQYYELAAYFAQTGLKADPASGDRNVGGTAVEGAKPLFEEVFDKEAGEMVHARTGLNVAPKFPFECHYQTKEQATRREQLAAWITSENNPYFATSFVNRLWGYLTGTGLIEPLDDIRAGNPPSNPELLQHLAEEFVASRFDTQHILRMICNSRTYQLSVSYNPWNVDDGLNYSHAKARRLPAEVLYDAVYRVTGAQTAIPGVQPGMRAAELPDVALNPPDGFLTNLGRPVRESACECERSDELQLGPVMALVSGPTIGSAIGDGGNELASLAQRQGSKEQMIEEVYLRVLNRYPTAEEINLVLQLEGAIEADHAAIEKSLAEKEAWWVTRRQQLEAARLTQLEETKVLASAREQEIAPDRQRLEQERLSAIEAAKKALEDYQQDTVAIASNYLASVGPTNQWFPLGSLSAESTNQAQLIPQSDRSIVVTGDAGPATFKIRTASPLRNIRGFRLEALPVEGIPGGGPGLPANGNFVITEIQVHAAAPGEMANEKLSKKWLKPLTGAKASYTQSGFDPAAAFDGKTRGQGGWAVHPRGGVVHWITAAFTEPIDFEGGVELVFSIHQYHDAVDHRLGRFRISLTTDEGEIHLGLPEEFTAASAIKENHRSVENLKSLIAYLDKSDLRWNELRTAVTAAEAPVPPDALLTSLQNQIAELEKPTPDDSDLVQLRRDHAASKEQLSNQRLTLAQDLTWALINSPAFLFNH